MANTFTPVYSWSEGDVTGKRLTCIRGALVLDSNGGGGVTYPLNASLFKLAQLVDVSNAVDASNLKLYPAGIFGTGIASDFVVFYDPAESVDADRPLFVELTSITVYLTVKGYPLVQPT